MGHLYKSNEGFISMRVRSLHLCTTQSSLTAESTPHSHRSLRRLIPIIAILAQPMPNIFGSDGQKKSPQSTLEILIDKNMFLHRGILPTSPGLHLYVRRQNHPVALKNGLRLPSVKSLIFSPGLACVGILPSSQHLTPNNYPHRSSLPGAGLPQGTANLIMAHITCAQRIVQ